MLWVIFNIEKKQKKITPVSGPGAVGPEASSLLTEEFPGQKALEARYLHSICGSANIEMRCGSTCRVLNDGSRTYFIP
jgi:hypothetical protein